MLVITIVCFSFKEKVGHYGRCFAVNTVDITAQADMIGESEKDGILRTKCVTELGSRRTVITILTKSNVAARSALGVGREGRPETPLGVKAGCPGALRAL